MSHQATPTATDGSVGIVTLNRPQALNAREATTAFAEKRRPVARHL